jgi:hypothetical protein
MTWTQHCSHIKGGSVGQLVGYCTDAQDHAGNLPGDILGRSGLLFVALTIAPAVVTYALRVRGTRALIER